MTDTFLGHVNFSNTTTLHMLSDDALQYNYHNSQITFIHHEIYQDLVIQFKGTLYNSSALKKTLGITNSTTDGQLIMIAYQKWDTSLLSKLDGIFSFVLFDSKKATLFLAKDRISVEPLFYYHDKESFIFGSSLRKLTQCPLFKKTLNFVALSNYFTYGYILQPNTNLKVQVLVYI